MPGGSAYVGGMQDNGTWRSPENATKNSNWFFQIGGDGYETSWHFDDPDKIIGGSQYNGLGRSLDGGQSWNSATSGLSNTGSGNAPFITKIAKTNQEPELLFAVGRNGVFRSTNFGGNWSLTSIPSADWGSIVHSTMLKFLVLIQILFGLVQEWMQLERFMYQQTKEQHFPQHCL